MSFTSFFHQILGNLVCHDQAALIGYVERRLTDYPAVAGEVRRCMNQQAASISGASLGVLRSLANQWLMDHR
jgi:hypothetical protein